MEILERIVRLQAATTPIRRPEPALIIFQVQETIVTAVPVEAIIHLLQTGLPEPIAMNREHIVHLPGHLIILQTAVAILPEAAAEAVAVEAAVVEAPLSDPSLVAETDHKYFLS